MKLVLATVLIAGILAAGCGSSGSTSDDEDNGIATDLTGDQATDQATDNATDQATDQTADQATDQGVDSAADQASDQVQGDTDSGTSDEGQDACVPSCGEKVCGSNGCDGFCGTCTGCDTCSDDGECVDGSAVICANSCGNVNGCDCAKCPGSSCDSDAQCHGSHCQNGFCCASGECCGTAEDCPDSFTTAAACDSVTSPPSDCQGHRGIAACGDSYQCTTESVDDDSACTSSIQAADCGVYPPVFCGGGPDQTAPVCASSCVGDSDCSATGACWLTATMSSATDDFGTTCADFGWYPYAGVTCLSACAAANAYDNDPNTSSCWCDAGAVNARFNIQQTYTAPEVLFVSVQWVGDYQISTADTCEVAQVGADCWNGTEWVQFHVDSTTGRVSNTVALPVACVLPVIKVQVWTYAFNCPGGCDGNSTDIRIFDSKLKWSAGTCQSITL